MFGIGGTELLVILVVALIVLGPKSLPKLARSLGKAMGEFRRVSTEFQRTMNLEAVQEEEKNAVEQARAQAAAALESADSSSAPQASADAPAEAGRKPDTISKTKAAAARKAPKTFRAKRA